MSFQALLRRIFPKLRYVFSGISVVMVLWLASHLFVRSIGGPFPQRTIGPLAKYEYYQNGDLKEWESILKPNPKTGLTAIESLIYNKPMPPLKFGQVPGDFVLPESVRWE